MKRSSFNLLLICFVFSSNGLQYAIGDELLDSLNGMHKLMTGEDDSFDQTFYKELVTCIEKYDNELIDVINAQWKGFRSYAEAGGNPGIDDWLRCDQYGHFLEHNCTVQEYGSIPIWEPCNYASNVCYYHAFVEICNHEGWSMPEYAVNGLGKIFAWPGATSSWMHGSLTTNGLFLDQRSNDLFAFATYQEMIKELEYGNQSVIHDLSYEERQYKAMTLVDLGMEMFISGPVEEWGFILKDQDFPTSVTTYCSFVMTTMTLAFDDDVVDDLVNTILAVAGDKLPMEIKEFCFETFLPEVRVATSTILPLPDEERTKLVGNFVGTVMKLGYGGIWEEGILPKLFQLPSLNKIGSVLLPIINDFATTLTTFEYYNQEYQHGKNFYPGEDTCNDWNPHTRWHLETAIGLPDFVFLADEIHRLIAQYS